MRTGVADGRASGSAVMTATGRAAPTTVPLRALGSLLAIGGALLALGVVAVAAVDIAGADVPGAFVHLTISQADLTPLAPIFNAAVVAVAVGGAAVLAVAVALRRAARSAWVVGTAAGVVAVVGFVLVASFTKQDWSQPSDLAGAIHRVGSLAAFIALPVSTIALTRRARTGRRLALASIVVALAGMASFVPIVVAILAVGSSGQWWLVVPLGLIERTIALCDIAALVLLAVRCRQELRRPDPMAP